MGGADRRRSSSSGRRLDLFELVFDDGVMTALPTEPTRTAEVPVELDPAAVPGELAEDGLRAAFAVENRAAWSKLRWLREACRSRAGTTVREPGRDDGAVAAAALGWSASMSGARLELADGVLERLPALGEAMAAGDLESTKAWLFVSTLRELDRERAIAVVERLLSRAPRTPHQKLREMIEIAAAEVDPDWDEARRAAALARARVLARIGPSGAAELSGLDLPWEAAKNAYDHLVAVADAVLAGLRAAGVERSEGVVQAHVFVRLLGRDHLGHGDPDLVARLTAELLVDGRPNDGGPDQGGPEGPDDGGPDDGGPDDGGPDGGAHGEACPDSDSAHPASDDAAAADGNVLDPGRSHALGSRLAFRRRVAIRMGLATLLRLDRRPAEMPSWGVVAAPTARSLALRRRAGRWRLHLYHRASGFLEHSLLVEPPGGGPGAPDDPHRAQIVELVAFTDELDALDPAEVLHGDLVASARAALAHARAHPERHPARSDRDAGRRFPGADLDDWVRARDRTCRFPGCSRPAYGADLDHTVAVTDDGPTLADNLGALCRRHHRLKHTPAAGWALEQPDAGIFVWTSPNGTRHEVRPEPFEPAIEVPPATGPGLPVSAFAPPRDVRPWKPRRNRHGHVTSAARATVIAIRAADRERRPPPPVDDEPPF
jgi:hypothetical protein